MNREPRTHVRTVGVAASPNEAELGEGLLVVTAQLLDALHYCKRDAVLREGRAKGEHIRVGR